MSEQLTKQQEQRVKAQLKTQPASVQRTTSDSRNQTRKVIEAREQNLWVHKQSVDFQLTQSFKRIASSKSPAGKATMPATPSKKMGEKSPSKASVGNRSTALSNTTITTPQVSVRTRMQEFYNATVKAKEQLWRTKQLKTINAGEQAKS